MARAKIFIVSYRQGTKFMIYELNCPYGLLEARLIRPLQHESHSGTLHVVKYTGSGRTCVCHMPNACDLASLPIYYSGCRAHQWAKIQLYQYVTLIVVLVSTKGVCRRIF